MTYSKSLGLIVFALIQSSFTTSYNKAENCFPETDMRIPVFEGLRADEKVQGLSEDEFNLVLDEIDTVFGPVLKARGKTLKINRLWTTDTINASAQQFGSEWVINMYGGLARHKHATLDSFRAVACHEIGHHIAGAPQKSSWWGGATWASNEGQSDYYATFQCMKKLILEGQDAGLEVKSPDLNIYKEVDVKVVNEACSERYPSISMENNEDDSASSTNENHANIFDSRNPMNNPSYEQEQNREFTACKRAALAGLSLGRLLSSVGDKDFVTFTKTDSKKVSSTNHNHPKSQCRADTYLAGALCDLDINAKLSNSNPNQGTCNRKDGFDYGLRPRCWYKPSN